MNSRNHTVRQLLPTYLVILFNILCGGLSILPLYFIYDSTPIIDLFASFINILWLVYHKDYTSKISQLPIFIISFLGVVFFQLLTGNRFLFSAAVFIMQLTFLLVLVKLHGKYGDLLIKIITDVYLSYSLANVICTILGVALILNGTLDATSNPIELNTFTKSEDMAFFPGYLTVLRPTDTIRTAFIPIENMVCGFSHEPHVVGYLCIPALFLWIVRLKSYKRLIIILLYVVFIVLTASTTSLLFVTFVFFIAVLLRPDQFGRSKIVTYAILVAIVFLVVVYQSFFIDNFSYFIDKAMDSGGSKGSSTSFFIYALMPHSLLGTNIYEFSGDDLSGDIGIPTAILNVIFYLSSFAFVLKMIKVKNTVVFWYGLSFFYFLLHSLKGMLLIYQYPYTIMMVYLSFVVFKYKDSEFEILNSRTKKLSL